MRTSSEGELGAARAPWGEGRGGNDKSLKETGWLATQEAAQRAASEQRLKVLLKLTQRDRERRLGADSVELVVSGTLCGDEQTGSQVSLTAEAVSRCRWL